MKNKIKIMLIDRKIKKLNKRCEELTRIYERKCALDRFKNAYDR